MATKKYTKEQVEKMSTEEVYAAFGTTEEQHMERMMALIAEENAKVEAELAAEVKKPAAKVRRLPGVRYGTPQRLAASNSKKRKKNDGSTGSPQDNKK